MELIFDIIDQSGRRLPYRKLVGERITVGRAMDNDLILGDPTVNPHHLIIEQTAEGEIQVTDLNTLNGTRLAHQPAIKGSATLQAGAEYLLGKTRLFIYMPDHPVEATTPVTEMDNTLHYLESPLLLAAVMMLVTLFYGMEQWLNMFSGFKWQQVANILLVVYGSAILLTLIWVVVGRVLRHEIQFRRHFTLILIFVIFQYFASKLFALVMFNTLSLTAGMVLLVLLEFVMLSTLLWFNLTIATNQNAMQRARTAAVIASLMIALSLYSEISTEDEFTEVPDYVRVLAPPALHFGGSVSEDEFVANTLSIFERLDEGE
jgi:pSer/pThr/pTyr-binding forkhead associated (FHA) protein